MDEDIDKYNEKAGPMKADVQADSLSNMSETNDVSEKGEDFRKPPDIPLDEEKNKGNKVKSKEINLSLSNNNTGGHVSKQENKADFLFKHSHINDLVIEVNKHVNDDFESKKIHFSKLENSNCQNNISLSARQYLDASLPNIIASFHNSRIAVINHNSTEPNIEIAAVEKIVFGTGLKHDSTPVCCAISVKDASLEIIIQQYNKLKTVVKNKAKQNTNKILVIYERKEIGNIDTNSNLLFTLFSKGGIASVLSSSLRTEGLYLVYVCANNDLIKITSRLDNYCPLLNITPIRLWLFSKISDFRTFNEIAALTETALYEYNWLSNSSLNEQKTELERQLVAGLLETEMRKIIDRIDKTEMNQLLELSKEPLNNIVLFTAVFFEGTSLDEFNMIVKLFIKETVSVNIDNIESQGKNTLDYLWGNKGGSNFIGMWNCTASNQTRIYYI